MAQSDWAECLSNLSTGSVDRGSTSGITPPNGGGSFIYGMNSLVNTAGSVALYAGLTNFSPTAAGKGGSIRGALQRGLSGGAHSFAPFLFIGLQSTDNTGKAYILGLQDDDPHRVALVKGTIAGGVPYGAVGSLGILALGTATYPIGTWKHIRLDMIVNANSDVILKCFQSDLVANPVTAPVWTAIPGIPDIVDDALGVNTGSQPFTSGRMGFGFQTQDISRRGYFDQIECLRQT